MTKSEPVKTTINENAETKFGFSPRIKMLATTAKNGDILFSIAASEIFIKPKA